MKRKMLLIIVTAIAVSTVIVIIGSVVRFAINPLGNAVAQGHSSQLSVQTKVALRIPTEVITHHFRVIAAPSLLEPRAYNILIYYIGHHPIQDTMKVLINGNMSGITTVGLIEPDSLVSDIGDFHNPSGLYSTNISISWNNSSSNEKEQIRFKNAKHDLKVEDYTIYRGSDQHWTIDYAYEQVGNQSFHTGYFGGILLMPVAGAIDIQRNIQYTVNSKSGKFTVHGGGGLLERWFDSFYSTQLHYIINSPTADVTVDWDGKTEALKLNRAIISANGMKNG